MRIEREWTLFGIRFRWAFVVFLFGANMLTTSVFAGSREDSRDLYNKIAGVPPTSAQLAEMTNLIDTGNYHAAAMLAVESSDFLNITMMSWLTDWTNRDQSKRVPLNDYSATLIGAVRDDIPFNKVLTTDIIYTASDEHTDTVGSYSEENNEHYEAIEDQELDLKTALVQRKQSALRPNIEPAGVMTTRAFAKEFYSAGTNRRAVKFLLINYICKDLEDLSDNTRPDNMIRRDVDRNPGGEVKVFRTSCAGCHSGMDGLGGAFAYYNYEDSKLTYTAGLVQPKMNQNAEVFIEGYVTKDDRWFNYWHEGPNSSLGWPSEDSGYGAASLGEQIGNARAFSTCMARKAFKKVCYRDSTTEMEEKLIEGLAEDFSKDKKFSIKHLFANTAVKCLTLDKETRGIK